LLRLLAYLGTEASGLVAAGLCLLLSMLSFALVFHAAGFSRQGRNAAPRKAPAPARSRVRPRGEEEDFSDDDFDEEDEPGRLALFVGVLGHIGLRLGSTTRRMAARLAGHGGRSARQAFAR